MSARAAIALSLVKGIGIRALEGLISRFGTAEAVFKVSAGALRSMRGLSEEAVQSLVKQTTMEEAKRVEETCAARGISVLFYPEEDYPVSLREIAVPPALLYYQGTLPTDKDMVVGILGSRKMSAYGATLVSRCVEALTPHDPYILGGFVHGIERHAVAMALRAGLRPLVVLPCGILKRHPLDISEDMVEAVRQRGCLVSEYLPLLSLPKYGFPMRNRLMVGFSRALVVVECGKESPVMRTASMGLNQGRDVYAFPTDINAEKQGGNYLIRRDVAKLVCSAEDLIKDLGGDRSGGLVSGGKGDQVASLSADEQQVVGLLRSGALHVDVLVEQTGLSADRLAGILLGLELRGHIQEMVGRSYALA